MYSDESDDDDEVGEEAVAAPLPSLDDPDFVQFIAYLGVNVNDAKRSAASGGGGSTSTSEGSASLSSFGSSPAKSDHSGSKTPPPGTKDGGAAGGETNTNSPDGGGSGGVTKDLLGGSTGGGSSASTSTPKKRDLDAILLSIVQEAYVAPLPPNWTEYADDEGRIYFYNHVTEVSSWAHPTDRTYKELIQMVRKVKAAALTKDETLRVIDMHLQSVHHRALEAIQGFSGPYASDDGHEYYYNENTGVSSWESPVVEWEYNISTRYHVLWSSLIEGQFEETDKPKLQLPLHLVSAAASNEPPTPSTSRSFHTARSQGSARNGSARSARASKSPKNTTGGLGSGASGSRTGDEKTPPSPGASRALMGGKPAPPRPDDDSDAEEPFNFTFGSGGLAGGEGGVPPGVPAAPR